MKKLLPLILITVIILTSLCGCSFESEEAPDIDYTSEILINKEMPDPSLVWEAYVAAPTEGRFIIEFSEYSKYAYISSSGIEEAKKRSCKSMMDLKSYPDSFFDDFLGLGNDTDFFNKNNTPKHALKFLGMTQQEFNNSINIYLDINDFNFYEDTAIAFIHIHSDVKIDNTDTTVKYAGQTLFVEHNYKKTYITAIDTDEIGALMKGDITSTYTGRIGDKFYYKFGYYSFTEHNFFPYLSPDDLPAVYHGEDILKYEEIYRTVLSDKSVDGRLPEYCFVQDGVRIGDRYHAVLSMDNRYYDDTLETYSGDTVFYAILDVATHEVVYLQKLFLKNYCGGYDFKLYSIGDDGIPYDTMLP